MSGVTTHVLDTALGVPAAGVPVRLLREGVELARAVTDADGRAASLGPESVAPGSHRLEFDVATYAAATGRTFLFPTVTITFDVREDAHHHVPLLLSPFAYTIYRGS